MAQKILVIDDDPDIGEFVCAAAQMLGWDCQATTSAINFLDQLRPDTTLILLDLMIPEIDGIELLRLLAKERCEVGIILMSGIGERIMETADELAASLGLIIAGHLHKPFRVRDLEAALFQSQVGAHAPTSEAKSRILIPKADLQLAMRKKEFVLHYQPLMDIRAGAVIGLEALIRLQHPQQGLVFPDNFLSRIESLGWIDELGWLVTRLAFHQVRRFADECGGEMLGISINASAHSLSDLRFPESLLEIAKQFDIPPEKVTIELTENGLIEELPNMLDVITHLRMNGIRLSIDDFDIGHSMMQQLRRIPATELKIDKSFAHRMLTNHNDRVLVQNTIEIGHELGMQVVAVGIETVEQLQLLQAIGCDLAQGFLFTRALPPKQMLKWLKEYRPAQSFECVVSEDSIT